MAGEGGVVGCCGRDSCDCIRLTWVCKRPRLDSNRLIRASKRALSEAGDRKPRLSQHSSPSNAIISTVFSFRGMVIISYPPNVISPWGHRLDPSPLVPIRGEDIFACFTIRIDVLPIFWPLVALIRVFVADEY
jgi:hypothetical protein